MICYDSSKAAKKALELAREHAKVCVATLEVVTSIMRDGSLERSFIMNKERSLKNEINEFLDRSDVSCKITLLIDTLSPGEQMVLFAEKEEIDQIFIGIEKKSKVSKLVFGSTAQYMILKAPCPVITVK
jgi:nucleotide-binding universal stress UspA family protein